MAISAHEALVLIDGVFNIDTVRNIEEHIDQRLKDPQWRKDWICGHNTDKPFFRFAVPGHATSGDKKEITRRYTEQGWLDVIVSNSSEGGERPGMMGIMVGVPSLEKKMSEKAEQIFQNFLAVWVRTGEVQEDGSPRETSELIQCHLLLGQQPNAEDCKQLGHHLRSLGWSFVGFILCFSEAHPDGCYDQIDVIKSKA